MKLFESPTRGAEVIKNYDLKVDGLTKSDAAESERLKTYALVPEVLEVLKLQPRTQYSCDNDKNRQFFFFIFYNIII